MHSRRNNDYVIDSYSRGATTTTSSTATAAAQQRQRHRQLQPRHNNDYVIDSYSRGATTTTSSTATAGATSDDLRPTIQTQSDTDNVIDFSWILVSVAAGLTAAMLVLMLLYHLKKQHSSSVVRVRSPTIQDSVPDMEYETRLSPYYDD